MCCFVSFISYSLSQKIPSDKSALLCICGKICILRTSSGSSGRARKAVCNDCIKVTSGCYTHIPFKVFILFVHGDATQT